ncbi:acyltransferase family protein [Luteimonas terrae]|uniref:Peptidoglycan/LPS O-acetylase OafA/YrhL n=1 Tax=Luteimonas terrae TaxID=1530191 RepID=A0ABU1Y0S4_9GAMM|nr:acyltransferase family protein [Luteimonas terrae]MDR7193901.1 peptidoglycan/LPS O-acetylase OafA/YrhL [Luteimonas terrae]
MNRRHDIDALRVIAFALLILYHVGMVYVVDWGFHIKSPTLLAWVEWPMVLVNRWRMSLLFLLAGIALGLVLIRKSPARLIGNRSWRLLLPLAFGIALIVPVQAWCEARMLGTYDAGFGSSLLRYLQLRPWPAGTFTGAEYGFTWNHLWYLPYLWLYTLLVLLALAVLRAIGGGRFAGWLTTRGRWLLWTVPPLWYLFALWVLDPRFPSTHALVGDWFNHARYFVVFAFGLLVARSDPFWSALLHKRVRLLWLAVGSGALYLGLRAMGAWLPDAAYLELMPLDAWRTVVRVIQTVYWWTALLALLAWSARLLDRPSTWLRYASEAVYPWYILHQSLIVLAAYWLIPLHLGALWEPLLVLAITITGCVLIHELLIRRIGWLRPLFGLPMRARMQPTARLNEAESVALRVP